MLRVPKRYIKMTADQKKEFTRKITQANSTELIVILYDICLVYVNEAIGFMEEGKKEEAKVQMDFAKRCIEEMINNLHFEYDLATVLHRIYLSMKKSLRDGMLDWKIEHLIFVKDNLSALRNSYSQIVSQDKSAPVMGHTQTVVAGLTYGKHSLNESLAKDSGSRGFFV